MSDNLVLEMLRAIRSDLADVKADLRDLKHHMSSLEISVAGLRRDTLGLYEQYAPSSQRSDTIEDRLLRIERRLELLP